MEKLPENVYAMSFGDFLKVEARRRNTDVEELEIALKSENIMYQTAGTGWWNSLEREIADLADQYLAITDFRLTPLGTFFPSSTILVQGTGVKE